MTPALAARLADLRETYHVAVELVAVALGGDAVAPLAADYAAGAADARRLADLCERAVGGCEPTAVGRRLAASLQTYALDLRRAAARVERARLVAA